MNFGEKLKMLRKQHKMTQQNLGNAINLSKANICKYEAGSLEPNLGTLRSLSQLFEVSLDYLIGEQEVEMPSSPEKESNHKSAGKAIKQTFRVLGDIACGVPILAQENEESFTLNVEKGAEINADFCLRARGDSMIGARIFDGDMVFIRKESMVDNGKIAAVLIDEEATLKRIRYDGKRQELTLYPENPKYETMHFRGEELGRIRILGRAIAFQSNFA